MYKDKKIIHIVARDSKGGIGKDNSLLWNVSEDMKFFRDSTLGHVCLVGRKTAAGFSKPLKRRICLCVSHSGIENTGTLDEALEEGLDHCDLLKTDEIFIIGGQQLYDSTFDIADELWITEILNEFIADKNYVIPEGFYMDERGSKLKSINGDFFYFSKWLRKV